MELTWLNDNNLNNRNWLKHNLSISLCRIFNKKWFTTVQRTCYCNQDKWFLIQFQKDKPDYGAKFNGRNTSNSNHGIKSFIRFYVLPRLHQFQNIKVLKLLMIDRSLHRWERSFRSLSAWPQSREVRNLTRYPE